MSRRIWHRVALMACCLAPLALHAGVLEGRILGRAGAPKPYVRVELNGPRQETVFTREDGTFSQELPAGRYVVRVIEGNQHMDFTLQFPEAGAARDFRLKW